MQTLDVPDEHLGVGFATIPVAPKCSIQLLLSDYEILSLADSVDVPAQLDDIPAWVVAAHSKQTDWYDASSLMLANDIDTHDRQSDSSSVDPNLDGDLMLSTNADAVVPVFGPNFH